MARPTLRQRELLTYAVRELTVSTPRKQGDRRAASQPCYYSQPALLFRLMTAEQKLVLCENTARALGDAPEAIKRRHISNCLQADVAYGEGVARALRLSLGQTGR